MNAQPTHIHTKVKVFLVFLLMSCSLYAQNRMYSDAINYVISHRNEHHVSIADVLSLQAEELSVNQSSFVIVNNDSGGWFILPSNDESQTILAYSPTGHLTIDSIGDGLWSFLEAYQEAITTQHQSYSTIATDRAQEETMSNDVEQSFDTHTAESLMRIGSLKWKDQGNNEELSWRMENNFYNQRCPINPNTSLPYPAGNTSVAMAIVLWYYQWPYCAIIPDEIDEDGNHSSSTHVQYYSWNSMPNAIYNNTPTLDADKVATLIRDCGYMTHMQYSSGNVPDIEHIVTAFQDMGYHTPLCKRGSAFANARLWENEIKQEFIQGRPVLFRYSAYNAIHTVVLYGFDGNYFKANFCDGITYPECLLSGESMFEAIQTLGSRSSQTGIMSIEPYTNCIGLANGNTLVYALSDDAILSQDMSSASDCAYFAASQIRLLPGFHAAAGGELRLGIRDKWCILNTTQHRGASSHVVAEPMENVTTETILPMLEGLEIAPNPVHDILTIKGSVNPSIELTIYSIQGQMLMRAIGASLDVSSLYPGYYCLLCNDDGNISVIKFVKK